MTTLPLRVVPQPTPFEDARQAGDCGACVLAGLTGLSISAVYDAYLPDRRGFTTHSMRAALWQAMAEGRLDRLITDIPIWPCSPGTVDLWGVTGAAMVMPWFEYVRMAIEAGYYGLTSVTFAKQGPPAREDHWVIICGAQERRIQKEAGAVISQEILVSCSARSSPAEEWVPASDFLQQRGGFQVFLARPTKR